LVPQIVLEVLADGGSVLVSDHRAETARLPGAIEWTVRDAAVTVTVPTASATPVGWLIEVAADDGPAAVATLRAAGHRIVRVGQSDAPVRPS
jgi:hypothetical protein